MCWLFTVSVAGCIANVLYLGAIGMEEVGMSPSGLDAGFGLWA